MKKYYFLIIFILGVLLIINPVYSCSCYNENTFEETVEKTDVIFSGKVVDIERDHAWVFMRYNVFFEVNKSWKGVSETNVIVATGSGMGDCGYKFTKGEEYLIFAYKHNDKLETDICTYTSKSSEVGEIVSKRLEKMPTIQLEHSNKTLIQWSLILYFLIVALIIFILFLIARKIIKKRKAKK